MNMQGNVVVVTGSNVGIGFETAVGVAALGATTVLACRNRPRPRRRPGGHPADLERRRHVVPLDLADLASVRKAAEDVLTRWDRLDVLVNNAGGTWTERG